MVCTMGHPSGVDHFGNVSHDLTIEISSAWCCFPHRKTRKWQQGIIVYQVPDGTFLAKHDALHDTSTRGCTIPTAVHLGCALAYITKGYGQITIARIQTALAQSPWN